MATRAKKKRKAKQRKAKEASVPVPAKPEIPSGAVQYVDGQERLASGRVRRDCRELTNYMTLGGIFSDEEVADMTRAMGKIVKVGSPREQVAAFKVLQETTKMAIELGKDQPSVQHLHLHAESEPAPLPQEDSGPPGTPILRLDNGIVG